MTWLEYFSVAATNGVVFDCMIGERDAARYVGDKWFASIQAAIEGEVQRLTQQLAGRVKELEERYVQRLPELERDVATLSTKFEDHLRRMGLVWA